MRVTFKMEQGAQSLVGQPVRMGDGLASVVDAQVDPDSPQYAIVTVDLP